MSSLRSFLRRPRAFLPTAYLLLLVLAAALAPLLAPYDATTPDLDHVLSGPGAGHVLGTDALGRDLLSRLMAGGRSSLADAAVAVLTVAVVGIGAGLAAGLLGGRTDRVFTWVADTMFAVPVLVTLLVVVAVVGDSQTAAMVTLGVLISPGPARLVRGVTLAVKQEPYIAAARVGGLSTGQIAVRHVLPRLAGPVVVQLSLLAGGALVVDAGLSYLGLGVQPPAPTWGNMIADAAASVDRDAWLLVPPGVVLGLAILSFGVLGDAVRDAVGTGAGAGTGAGQAVALSRRKHRRRPALEPATVPAAIDPAATDLAATVPMATVSAATVSAAAVQAVPDLVAAPVRPADGNLLALREVSVAVPTRTGWTTVVANLSLDIAPGETVGLVGESGCGKTVTSRIPLGLIPGGGRVTAGRIWFDGAVLDPADRRAVAALRGSAIGLVGQDPMAALDPVFPVGRQVAELVRRHHGGSRESVRARTLQLFEDVNLGDPELVAGRYPHELSGGMAQRVAIALALAGQPRLLVADEPTTALDAAVRTEVLGLLRRLQAERGMAILLVSHDWGVIQSMCQRAYVMYAGQVVETAPTAQLEGDCAHPYTAGLLAAAPRGSTPREPLRAIPGQVPHPGAWPFGCHFAPRCTLATAACSAAPIPVIESGKGHLTRCIHHEQMLGGSDCGDRERTPAGHR